MSDAELDATLDEYDGCVRDLAQLSTQGMSDIALATQADNARDRIVAAFAAARREVEAVRDTALMCQGQIEALRGLVDTLEAAAVRQAGEVETVTRERDEARKQQALCEIDCANQEARANEAEADLTASRAALEDVRRVEAWVQAHPDREIGRWGIGYRARHETDDGEVISVKADSLAALGRALAQEAGDA